jgi:hypothetical protein
MALSKEQGCVIILYLQMEVLTVVGAMWKHDNVKSLLVVSKNANYNWKQLQEICLLNLWWIFGILFDAKEDLHYPYLIYKSNVLNRFALSCLELPKTHKLYPGIGEYVILKWLNVCQLYEFNEFWCESSLYKFHKRF